MDNPLAHWILSTTYCHSSKMTKITRVCSSCHRKYVDKLGKPLPSTCEGCHASIDVNKKTNLSSLNDFTKNR